MGELRALAHLCACLNGRPPSGCDWTQVANLANQSLVTPQLAAALEPVAERVPAGIAGFLDEVRRRNAERSRRLWRQLNDAVAALNAAGLTPGVLKGAALWARGLATPDGDRLLSDIDLLVAPHDVEAAVEALRGAGFDGLARYPGASVHVAAELGRPHDPGVLDLHQRPPGPPGVAEPDARFVRWDRVEIEGGTVTAPDAAGLILHLVLHDQFHDGGYWRGGFDLRHLIDLARLVPMLSEADWRRLRRACGTDLVRAALDAQLLSAERLIGGITSVSRPSLHARLTHQRWRLQYARPALRPLLAALAFAIDWPLLQAHHAADRQGRRRVLGSAAAKPFSPFGRLDRLRRILQVESGKI